MVKTGRVEIVGETYYHSLAFFYSVPEFERQVEMHAAVIKRIFGVKPKVLRNTELAYTNSLAEWASQNDYKAVLLEGWDAVLGWRAPTFVYRPPKGKTSLLMKHYKLSDDIAFRFHDSSWAGWPLTADKFAHWVHSYHGNGQVVNLFLDYETFGEHKWADTGIFDFVRHLPSHILSHPDTDFVTVSEAATRYKPVGVVDVPHVVSWADTDRDLSAWIGNDLQRSALSDVYAIEAQVLATKDQAIIDDWRKLQTSDHFYYMCTKWFNDGDIHAYFNPYESPYNAYIAFRNALADLMLRIDRPAPAKPRVPVKPHTAPKSTKIASKKPLPKPVKKAPAVKRARRA
jgi:alpha-amylase